MGEEGRLIWVWDERGGRLSKMNYYEERKRKNCGGKLSRLNEWSRERWRVVRSRGIKGENETKPKRREMGWGGYERVMGEWKLWAKYCHKIGVYGRVSWATVRYGCGGVLGEMIMLWLGWWWGREANSLKPAWDPTLYRGKGQWRGSWLFISNPERKSKKIGLKYKWTIHRLHWLKFNHI